MLTHAERTFKEAVDLDTSAMQNHYCGHTIHIKEDRYRSRARLPS